MQEQLVKITHEPGIKLQKAHFLRNDTKVSARTNTVKAQL